MQMLTPRQLIAIAGRAAGLSYKEIGAKMHISDKTVQAYISAASQRLGLPIRKLEPWWHVREWWREHGLLEHPFAAAIAGR